MTDAQGDAEQAHRHEEHRLAGHEETEDGGADGQGECVVGSSTSATALDVMPPSQFATNRSW